MQIRARPGADRHALSASTPGTLVGAKPRVGAGRTPLTPREVVRHPGMHTPRSPAIPLSARGPVLGVASPAAGVVRSGAYTARPGSAAMR